MTGSGILGISALCGLGLILLSIYPGWMEKTESVLASLALQALLYYAWAADWAVSMLAAAALLISFLAVQRTAPGYWMSALLFSALAGTAAAFLLPGLIRMPAWIIGLAAGGIFILLHLLNRRAARRASVPHPQAEQAPSAPAMEPADDRKEEASGDGN